MACRIRPGFEYQFYKTICMALSNLLHVELLQPQLLSFVTWNQQQQFCWVVVRVGDHVHGGSLVASDTGTLVRWEAVEKVALETLSWW